MVFLTLSLRFACYRAPDLGWVMLNHELNFAENPHNPITALNPSFDFLRSVKRQYLTILSPTEASQQSEMDFEKAFDADDGTDDVG